MSSQSSQLPSEAERYRINSNKKQFKKHRKLRRRNKARGRNRGQRPPFYIPETIGGQIPAGMSDWAETFTRAATWQLKNQVAYWKSKAIALEYENKILHDTIQKLQLGETRQATDVVFSDDESDDDKYQDANVDEDIEVSEEYVQFLMKNREFRNDARNEREKLAAREEAQKVKDMEAGPPARPECRESVFKRLYGDRWEKLSALEMSLELHFLDICDREKPKHWPNIPFNFSSVKSHNVSPD